MGRGDSRAESQPVAARPQRPNYRTVKSSEPLLDLGQPNHSYLFGFLLGDGHLAQNTRNRGRLEVEIGVRDELLLRAFQTMVPVYSSITTRVRSTNFKAHHQRSEERRVGKER